MLSSTKNSKRRLVIIFSAAASFFAIVAIAMPTKAQAGGTWSKASAMASVRANHTATLLENGKVLVAGGGYTDNAGHHDLSSAELYDPAIGKWRGTHPMTVSRSGHTATRLNNGKVLVVGWHPNDLTTSAELYDPASGTWSQTGSMAAKRVNFTATLLQNGKVLIAGGSYSDSSGTHYNLISELYDPTTGTWSQTGSISMPREFHAAALLSNGKVLVSGGAYFYSNLHCIANSELYNPTTGKWSNTGFMTLARAFHTATPLANGNVLVSAGMLYGGSGWKYYSSAELYTSVTGKWGSPSTLASPRQSHTATMLSSGKVLVAGGSYYDNSYARHDLLTAELYDPITNRWVTSGVMSTARFSHTATLLKNGKVLVAGGEFWDSKNAPHYLSSADLYTP